MSRSSIHWIDAFLRFPRVSGDEPSDGDNACDDREFSPRERG